MIGHLGPRVSALLDGQMLPAEADEAWAHVYTCHQCRDLVEREGWIKTRLSGLADADDPTCPAAPSNLKGSLLNLTPGEAFLVAPHIGAQRRGIPTGVAVVGGGALGAALLGVLALGVLPGATAPERRPPVTRIDTGVPSPTTHSTTPTAPSAPSGRISGSLSSPGTDGPSAPTSTHTWAFFE